MASELAHQIAMVTGAGQGLGRGIALELAKAGANLVVTHLDTPVDTDNAQTVVAEIEQLNRKAIALPLDITDQSSIEHCERRLIQQMGRIDILVNNAGVMQKGTGFSPQTSDDFAYCYQVNVEGVWRMSQAIIPHFKTQQCGKIINVASIAGRGGSADLPAYSASKAAVINLTQSMALELGPDNINVNAICPGTIWTPMWQEVESILSHTDNPASLKQKAAFTAITAQIPLRRPQHPEDIGHAVAFFASPRAKNITGQSLNVDGGLVAH